MNCKGWSVERGFPATAKKPGRGPAIHEAGNGMRANGPTHKQVGMGVCVHYCSTYYKAVREGGPGGVDRAQTMLHVDSHLPRCSSR